MSLIKDDERERSPSLILLNVEDPLMTSLLNTPKSTYENFKDLSDQEGGEGKPLYCKSMNWDFKVLTTYIYVSNPCSFWVLKEV